MKKLILYLTFNLCIILGMGQGVIIDHNCVDVSQIPNQYVDLVKANTKMQWCGQSHSNQGLCGIDVVESLNPVFQSEHIDLILPDDPNSLDVYVGNYGYDNPGCCTSITPQGYWIAPGPEWENDLFTHWPAINVSIFNWCWQLQSNGSAYVQQYLDQMEIFEDLYPWCTFVYTTNNAQAWGEEGLTRATNNDLIRQYCITNNKVLFDFADLDSWYNGEHATTTYNGITFEVQHAAYDCSSCCGHVNELGTEQKGRAIWWLAARLQGWNPLQTNNPPVIDAELQITSILYPNLANNFINVGVENTRQETIGISILTMKGEEIYREESETVEGGLLKRIDINQLSKGLYIVNIQCGEKMLLEKFIKL